MRASDLKALVAFEQKGAAAWEEQFKRRAKCKYLRGGEDVVAGRLAGTSTAVITVRRCVKVMDLNSTSWRIKEVSRGVTWNIKSIIPAEDGRWVEFTCQSVSK